MEEESCLRERDALIVLWEKKRVLFIFEENVEIREREKGCCFLPCDVESDGVRRRVLVRESEI